ncbi:GlsB/YeaQ/YmgE family stress response membrane protein [Tundrisphaera sp. TA3]|uniref:GlsB/YeaQ/YmgE family stress response membrane protein n=1 Tax=Tundrisphaera sp. TA3 TaxID=3435775 RepID=UPI003EBDC463
MPFLLSDIALAPGNIVAWLVVGLISGFLAGTVMKGGGFGLLGDIVVGLVGAMIGGFVVGFFDTGVVGFWGTTFVAFLGSCILIAIVRAVQGKPAL